MSMQDDIRSRKRDLIKALRDRGHDSIDLIRQLSELAALLVWQSQDDAEAAALASGSAELAEMRQIELAHRLHDATDAIQAADGSISFWREMDAIVNGEDW